MAVALRSGTKGSYYGSTHQSSASLTLEQMKVNAIFIKNYLLDEGWSLNSICALLGNMQAESTINPGRWQNDDFNNTLIGFGLVQWTPASKYINWANSQQFPDYTTMDANLSRIVYEVENNEQWIASNSYNFTFKEFSQGKKQISGGGYSSIEYSLKVLTEAFLINYERPADQSESVKEYRTSLANDWYTYLSTNSDIPETPTTPLKTKRKKYKFLLFNARKRRNEWIRKR